MIKIQKILWFISENTANATGVCVIQDVSGFYYLNALIKEEGFMTPFASIEEICVVVGEQLTLLSETEVTEELRAKWNSNSKQIYGH